MEDLKRVKESLKTSASLTGYRLPVREKEFDGIHDYILERFHAQSGGCFYIAGVPGTGKTATVRGVRRSIEENYKKLKIGKNAIKFIEVNALKLVDPYQCYSQIYRAIDGKTKSARKAQDLLIDIFCNSVMDQFYVLIVDEIDCLQTSKQDIIYHLFDWPTRPDSRLVVIAIANTLDLPDRLDKRVVSRAGFTRMHFQPYKHEELTRIVAARIKENTDVIESQAIQFCARKVASISGDARKVLEICRRAIEITERKYEKGKLQVTIKEVQKAINEASLSPKMIYIRDASEYEQQLLRAIIKHFQQTGIEEGTCRDIYHYWHSFTGEEANFSEFLEVAYSLHESRIIIIEPTPVESQRRIRLIVSTDDIDFALETQ